jgi:hypothetical protein
MMIGPAAMIRIEEMSVRFGILGHPGVASRGRWRRRSGTTGGFLGLIAGARL